jgi:hypothetical protein
MAWQLGALIDTNFHQLLIRAKLQRSNGAQQLDRQESPWRETFIGDRPPNGRARTVSIGRQSNAL